MENKIFYNLLSSDYDEMISFEKSLERKKRAFSNFLTADMKYAADVGCGTGVDSVALAQLGLNVTAFDPSDEMIQRAKANAEIFNEQIEFNNHPIKGIPDSFNNSFDLIVSLGNTFANIHKEDLNLSIKKCYDLLNQNGILIIHILNYYKILKEKTRIVSITQGKENIYIRFYDFESERVKFNILTYKKSELSEFKLLTTVVYPHMQEDFKIALATAGFSQPKIYSNLNFDEFIAESSKDMFLRAIKD